jgi:hypothetical protein
MPAVANRNFLKKSERLSKNIREKAGVDLILLGKIAIRETAMPLLSLRYSV